MNRELWSALALLCLSAGISTAEESLSNQHWEITLGDVYEMNSFFCTSEEAVDKLIKAREAHHRLPSVAFRFPEECKLARFAFRPLRLTEIETSYYIAQRDSGSETSCTNSRGKIYPCSFIHVTSRYIFGHLLLRSRALNVYVEAPSSITVTVPVQ